MWFLFAFALSVEGAFGHIGENATAHDLALGCLLAWFPILIMGSIVDRNPIAAESIRKKLNALVDHVRHAIRNKQRRDDFVDTFRDHKDFTNFKIRVDYVAEGEDDMYEFFEEFAGQARVRWHYGAAHPILSDIEDCYIAEKGRNWLADENDARLHLVLGSVNDEGLMWFDIREFWQVGSAILIVGGSCGGAFILSYFTPTVGLGCRSGGYTIFFSVALGLMLAEMMVWLVESPYQMRVPWLVWLMNWLRGFGLLERWESKAQGNWTTIRERTHSFGLKTENKLIRAISWLSQVLSWKGKHAMRRKVTDNLEESFRKLRLKSTSKKWEMFFFRPIEAFNTIWLVSPSCFNE
jgi:hypothetical protein